MIAVDPDPVTTLGAALFAVWRNYPDRAQALLAGMSRDDLRTARTTLRRVEALLDVVWYQPRVEDVAAAILTPDALPDGVAGFGIDGRST